MQGIRYEFSSTYRVWGLCLRALEGYRATKNSILRFLNLPFPRVVWGDGLGGAVATAAAVTATTMITAAVIGSMVNTIPPSCAVTVWLMESRTSSVSARGIDLNFWGQIPAASSWPHCVRCDCPLLRSKCSLQLLNPRRLPGFVAERRNGG